MENIPSLRCHCEQIACRDVTLQSAAKYSFDVIGKQLRCWWFIAYREKIAFLVALEKRITFGARGGKVPGQIVTFEVVATTITFYVELTQLVGETDIAFELGDL